MASTLQTLGALPAGGWIAPLGVAPQRPGPEGILSGASRLRGQRRAHEQTRPWELSLATGTSSSSTRPGRRAPDLRLRAMQKVMELATENEKVISEMASTTAWSQALAIYARLAKHEPDVELYEVTAEALVKAGQWESALAVVADLKAAASDSGRSTLELALSEDSETIFSFSKYRQLQITTAALAAEVNAWVIAAERSIEAGEEHWTNLLSSWEEMKRYTRKIPVGLIASTMKTCNNGGQWRLALTLQDGLPGGTHRNARVAAEVLNAWAASGSWERAVDALNDMRDKQITPTASAYNRVILICSQQMPTESEVEAMTVKELPGWASCGLGLLAEMQQQGHTPQRFCYVSVLNICGRIGDAETALKLLEEMKAAGIAPGLFAYTAAITAISGSILRQESLMQEDTGPGWTMALQLLEELSAEGCSPNVVCITAAMSACRHARKWRQALHLAEGLGNRDIRSFSVVIGACAKAKQWRWAIELMSQVRARKLKPDGILHGCMITAFSRGQQLQRALDQLEIMVKEDLTPDRGTYHMAFRACSWGDQWQRALFMLDKMEEQQLSPDQLCFGLAISTCDRARQWLVMLELLEEMTSREMTPDLVTYSLVVGACKKIANELQTSARALAETLEVDRKTLWT